MNRTIRLSFICTLLSIHFLNAQNAQRLTTGWEYIQATQGSIWEVWRDSQYQVRSWQKVELPHCFNALDAVDPHTIYYQGEGWYRTMLKTANPYKNGRTLLHFEGAGQKTKVYLGNQEVGSHVGGYDEFTVDLTDAMTAFPKQTVFTGKKNNQFPIAVACDNGRDMELIPSNLSDFNLYGGLYRYVNLVYTPAISIERLQIENKMDPLVKTGFMTIKAKIYNPNGLKTPLNFKIQVFDPSGKEVFTDNIKTETAETLVKLATHTFEKPLLWDTDKPNLYQCRVTLQSSEGEMQVSEKTGFRHTEFKEKGPFFLNGKRLLLRGTHRHEDHAGTAAAMTEDMMREEMKLIKDMGANICTLVVRLGCQKTVIGRKLISAIWQIGI